MLCIHTTTCSNATPGYCINTPYPDKVGDGLCSQKGELYMCSLTRISSTSYVIFHWTIPICFNLQVCANICVEILGGHLTLSNHYYHWNITEKPPPFAQSTRLWSARHNTCSLKYIHVYTMICSLRRWKNQSISYWSFYRRVSAPHYLIFRESNVWKVIWVVSTGWLVGWIDLYSGLILSGPQSWSLWQASPGDTVSTNTSSYFVHVSG